MPAAADILSDPIINQAYEDVRSDKSDTTWMVLKVRHAHRLPSSTRKWYSFVLKPTPVCVRDV
jgi:hypothetical protein